MGRRGGRARRFALVSAVCAAALVAPSAAASAVEVRAGARQRILGDLTQQQLTIELTDGRVARGNLLRFPESSPTLTLRPELANRSVVGLETMTSMGRRLRTSGGVAGTNGGYWIDRPSGNPNGLHVQGNRMVGSNASTAGGGQRTRAAVGIRPTGRTVHARVQVEMELTLPGGHRIPIRHVNRGAIDGSKSEVLLYDRSYGGSFVVPAGSVLLVTDELVVRASGRTANPVRSVRSFATATTARVDPGTTAILLIGTHSRGPVLDLGAGDRVGVETTIAPEFGDGTAWGDLSGALPGGGLLLRNGTIPALTSWTEDGFGSHHFTNRHPRTAVGRRPGEVLLLTVDGRQSSSVGVTARELAEVFRRLGANDAVNLDGGGSTTMIVDGRIRNRPSEANRSVASGLFVHAPLPPTPRSPTRACPTGQVPRAGFTDTRGTTHEGPIDCLAWWGVTTGTSRTTYTPRGPISRAQLASMLARWIDDAATRGRGRALPTSGTLRFRDVASGSTHAPSIARLHAAGIVNGTSATTYAPNKVVSRAELATLLDRSVAYVTGTALPRGPDTFVDDNGSVHEPALDRLARARILGGTGGHRAAPRAALTRAAMASLLVRASDLLVQQEVVTPPR